MVFKIKYVLKDLNNMHTFKLYDDNLVLNYKIGEYLIGDDIFNIIAKFKEKDKAMREANKLDKNIYIVVEVQEYEKFGNNDR